MYLNCHTYFSFKFGTMKPEELLHEAVANGVRRFVVSDINNTSAILDCHRFVKDYSKKYPVQPITGIDFRLKVPPDSESSRDDLKERGEIHFIGIAKNYHGFFELNNFLSKCLHEGENGLTGREATLIGRVPKFEDAFVVYPFSSLLGVERRPVPFFSGSNLREDGNCFSRRNGGIAMTTLGENEFIGIKPSDLNRLKFSQWKNNPEKLLVLAPVTFRNKIPRCNPKTDFNAHRLLRAMDNNIVLSKLPVSEQASPDEIMMNEEELIHLYKDFPQIIYNTKKLLDECEPINFEFGENKNKNYFLHSAREDHELLMQLCEKGMKKRYAIGGADITARFEKEINIITQKQFSSYFLINHDIIQFAQRKNFFYVGRGSGANSMVAYLLYITDVDPIELDLYFERFINPSRKNPPDFDIDFSSDERDEVIKYIFGKYGNERTALLATYSEMKEDSLIRELGKVFGLPKKEIDALQDGRSHPETDPHLLHLISQYKEVLKTFPSHLSIHAGGILISEKAINYYTAVSNPPKGFPLTQFSMQEAEDVGFAKFDILAQRGLGKVRDAVDIIRENQKVNIDIHEVEKFKKDDDVRKNLKSAKLMGCFYVESPAMRMLLTKLKAETYLDLVAASSIIRPGVAQSGMMQEYIRRFHAPDHGKSKAIPELWDIMEETFGVMVYQEDVIKVAYHFGGFTLEEADKLRRGMGGKYRGRQEFLEVKDKFFANCRAKGKDEKLINEVWFQMETFGGYAFAKGHSASYAVESYQCMFLKTHYPLEYMVAVINNGGGFFGVQYYIHEAHMCNGNIHAPDINKSGVLTTIYEKDIYLGLNLLNDLERKLQQEIVDERNRNGEFSSLENFLRRVSIPVEQLRILIRIGAFRFTGRTKKQLMWDIHSILGHQKKSVARKELFEGENKKYSLPELFNDQFEDARDENEILRFPLRSPFGLIASPYRLSHAESRRDDIMVGQKSKISLSSEGAALHHEDKSTTTKNNVTPVGLTSDSDLHYHTYAPAELHNSNESIDIIRSSRGGPIIGINNRLLLVADLKNLVGKTIEIIGHYVTRKPTSTKKGEPMMFGCFLDREGFFFDTNHFPEATRKFPFRGAGCYVVKGKVAEEFGFYSINVLEMHKLDYLMYEDDAEEKARSKPDPVIVPKVVEASKQYQYLLVISPPPHIWKEIELLKKKFHQQFDHYQAIASKPDITLSGFTESEMKQTEIVKQIAGVANQSEPLKVFLEDFKNFDHKESYSIVIDVVNPDEIIGMVQKLKKELSLPSKYSRFIFNPHVTIARGLDQEKFSRASAEFCEMNYAASFVARSITLLKREANVKFAKYEVLKEFRLEGKANNMRMPFAQKRISVAQ